VKHLAQPLGLIVGAKDYGNLHEANVKSVEFADKGFLAAFSWNKKPLPQTLLFLETGQISKIQQPSGTVFSKMAIDWPPGRSD
jgi:hypothetical protein